MNLFAQLVNKIIQNKTIVVLTLIGLFVLSGVLYYFFSKNQVVIQPNINLVKVTINKNTIEANPTANFSLHQGKYLVTLEKEGYVTLEKEINVLFGTVNYFQFSLEKDLKTLKEITFIDGIGQYYLTNFKINKVDFFLNNSWAVIELDSKNLSRTAVLVTKWDGKKWNIVLAPKLLFLDDDFKKVPKELHETMDINAGEDGEDEVN